MYDYDNWLLSQADEYTSPCKPETDKNGEYTQCQECFDKCELWNELQAEIDEATLWEL